MCDCTEAWFCSKQKKVGSRHTERAGSQGRGPTEAAAPLGVAETRLGQGRNLGPVTRMSQGTFLRALLQKSPCLASAPSPSPHLLFLVRFPWPTASVFGTILFQGRNMSENSGKVPSTDSTTSVVVI